FIDVNYHYMRETKIILDLRNKLKNAKEEYEKLTAESINSPQITEDYFTSKLDIAMNKYNLIKNRRSYTHCEIHGSSIMSISESIIPLANRNPTTRVGFQCGMGRQALGIFHSNERYRFDTTT